MRNYNKRLIRNRHLLDHFILSIHIKLRKRVLIHVLSIWFCQMIYKWYLNIVHMVRYTLTLVPSQVREMWLSCMFSIITENDSLLIILGDFKYTVFSLCNKTIDWWQISSIYSTSPYQCLDKYPIAWTYKLYYLPDGLTKHPHKNFYVYANLRMPVISAI